MTMLQADEAEFVKLFKLAVDDALEEQLPALLLLPLLLLLLLPLLLLLLLCGMLLL